MAHARLSGSTPALAGRGWGARVLLHPAAKPVLFVLCLLPLAWLVYGAVADRLGANPAEALIRSTGDWTLRMLCLTLAVTPLRLALAATSFNRAMRWMGGRRWQQLHRGVYLAAGLAILHFFWMRSGKNDFVEVAVYAAILAALLLARPWLRRRRRAV